MCPEGDIGEDNGQRIISPFGQVLCFLNILCVYIPCNKLTNCYINMLSNTSQTTLVQIMHVFCCFVLYNFVCVFLISVRVLLVT